MKNLFTKLETLGLDTVDLTFPLDKIRLILTNRIAIICNILAIPYIIIFYLFKLPIASLMVIPLVLIFTLVLVANNLGKKTTAKLLIIWGASIGMLAFSLYLGASAGSYLVLFGVAAWALTFFNDNQALLRTTHVIIPIITSFNIQFIEIYYPSIALTSLDPILLKWIHLIATTTAFLVVISTVQLFKISEREAQAQLKRSKKDLEKAYIELKENKIVTEKLANQSAFATLTRRIAHEIKNPMTMLLSRAELVQDQLDNPTAVKKFSDMMLRNITRILKLMESMLKYGAHPSEKKESFSVNKVLEDIIELIQPKCKEDFIHLDTELKEKVSSFGCPINIYQAILNVTVNAIQYSQKDGLISIRLTEPVTYLNKEQKKIKGSLIEVEDNGSGISQHNLKKIF